MISNNEYAAWQQVARALITYLRNGLANELAMSLVYRYTCMKIQLEFRNDAIRR